mgnify:CR=1 FL=1
MIQICRSLGIGNKYNGQIVLDPDWSILTNTLSDNDVTLSSTLDNILLGDYSNLDIDDETHRRLRVLLAHDDMYFCPEWDKVLISEIKKKCMRA